MSRVDVDLGWPLTAHSGAFASSADGDVELVAAALDNAAVANKKHVETNSHGIVVLGRDGDQNLVLAVCNTFQRRKELS